MVSGKHRGSHQAIRRKLLPEAYGKCCHLCGQPMLPGQQLDLDHHPDGHPDHYRGMAHAFCNRSEGGRRGRANQLNRRIIMDKYAVGIDIAWDRSHTSVARAGHVDGLTSVDLTYLDGAATVDQVTADLDRKRIVATVVDPKSPAVTLLQPLRKANTRFLQELTTSQAVECHHLFLDELAADRIRHSGHPALNAAMQYAHVRHLGGGEAVDRRKDDADVSPLTATQLAVFGLLRLKQRPPRIYAGDPATWDFKDD